MKRYDFVYLFEVRDANPNGDPDAGNLPRVDPETGQGLVTDVCLKRKVRNYVSLVHGGEAAVAGGGNGFEIYFVDRAVLNRQHERAYQAAKLKPIKKKLPKKAEDARAVTAFMCRNFFDIRTFGAVMSTEVNCGQVRGPIQLSFARSLDPIVTAEHAITRSSVTNERDLEKERTMGRKFTVPYGVYRAHGFVNPFLAERTGFDETDLELLWRALENAFEFDRSAARPAGSMSARALVVFEHDSKLGNAPAHRLLDSVVARRRPEVSVARSFEDYEVLLPAAGDLPAGVRCRDRLAVAVG